MKKLLPILLIASILAVSSVSLTGVIGQTTIMDNTTGKISGYMLQWSQNYGTDPRSCARYQGPQPIGDADNDGKNELLISGRDEAIRVMKWNEAKQNYTQVRVIRPPFYPFVRCDAGGMAIGDVTNDGDNEVAATWYTTVYKYFLGKYRMIGMNPWIFRNEGGSADIYIGDCDNDGKNEVILSGGPFSGSSPVPEITVFRWNGLWLQKVAEWKDPNVIGYVYMAGVGDVDNDGLNELVCAYSNKVVVLNWDEQNKVFEPTMIFKTMHQQDSPFSIVCKDCDNDGNDEILLGYYAPHITIFKWNGTGYAIQFDISWPGADPIIEGIDVGDTDNDGLNEVCAGAGVTHILQWNGTTYVEEAILPTWGWMAVVCIGDCDNDGKNEINTGNVEVDEGQSFMEWVFKYE